MPAIVVRHPVAKEQPVESLAVGDIVRFREELEPGDLEFRFVVVEHNGDRVRIRDIETITPGGRLHGEQVVAAGDLVKAEEYALADEFCRVLNEWLTAEQLAEINRRNATPEYQSACASHDFCDPNQAMLDAMDVLGIEFNDNSHDLINRAWSIARKRGFAVR